MGSKHEYRLGGAPCTQMSNIYDPWSMKFVIRMSVYIISMYLYECMVTQVTWNAWKLSSHDTIQV